MEKKILEAMRVPKHILKGGLPPPKATDVLDPLAVAFAALAGITPMAGCILIAKAWDS